MAENLGSGSRVYQTATLFVLALICLVCITGIIIPAGLGWDFANYYDAGHKAAVGETGTLYEKLALIEGEPPQGAMLFLGVPISSYLYTPLAFMPPETALVVFKVQATLCTWLALLLVYRATRPVAASAEEMARFTFLFVTAALLFQPFWTIYRVGGQTTPNVLLMCVLAWLSYRQGRAWVTVALLIAAIAIKPVMAPALLLLAAASGRNFLVATFVIGFATALLSVLLMGWPIHGRFLQELGVQGSILASPKWNSAITAWIEAAFLSPSTFETGGMRPEPLGSLLLLTRMAVLGVFAVLFLDLRKRSTSEPARRSLRFLLAVTFALMFTPVAWEHYPAILFPLIAVLLARWRMLSQGSRLLLAATIASSVFQNLILIMWFDDAIGFDTWIEQAPLGMAKSSTLVLVLCLLVFKWRDVMAAFDGTMSSSPATAPSSAEATLARVRSAAPKGLARFLLVGLGGLLVDLALLSVLELGGASHVFARAASLAAATVVTWILNRNFTFGASGGRVDMEFGRYGLIALGAQSINYAVFIAMIEVWPAVLHTAAAIVGAVIAAGFSYAGHRFFTFSKRQTSREG